MVLSASRAVLRLGRAPAARAPAPAARLGRSAFLPRLAVPSQVPPPHPRFAPCLALRCVPQELKQVLPALPTEADQEARRGVVRARGQPACCRR